MITRLLLITLFLISHSCFATEKLYPGEELRIINQTQTLIKFIKGNPQKPLVIFVPGDSHLARIAYGFPGGDEKDFLSYWLHREGYSFLGVSYPLDNPVFTKMSPEMTIQAWGCLIANVAADIIHEQHLNNHVVIAGWSMGGSIEETATLAAKNRGLIVDAFIGLSAAPPLPYIMQKGIYDTNELTTHQLANRKKLYPLFTRLLAEQNKISGHEVIPPKIYVSEFLGDIPVALSAEGYYLQNGKVIHDVAMTIRDGGVFDFANTPWIALIRDDAKSTAKLSLIDPASWDFLRAEMIYENYMAGKAFAHMPDKNWQKLTNTIQHIPQQLMLTVHGNHFFFVGQTGAKTTAKGITELLARIEQLKQQLVKL